MISAGNLPKVPLRRLSSFGSNWSTATILIFLVGLGTFIRNLAVNYPLIFGDEGIFLIRAKYAGRPQMLAGDELAAWVPNSLYLWVNHSIFFLGSNYAIGARLINVLFFVVSLIVLYAIASLFVSSRKAALAALVVGVGPMSVYTAFVMPETMFLYAFLCLAFVLIRYSHDHPIYAGFLSGVVLGGAALIKPHGLLLIPVVLFALLILKLSVPEWCRWTTCGFAAAAVVGAAFATIELLDYLTLGQFGFSLGPTYTTLVSKSSAAWSIAPILSVMGGHVALVLSLYALPVLVVLMALLRGTVATRSLSERIKLRMLLIFAVSTGCLLLITTSKFTVSVVGLSPYEQLNRVHVRYYFFVLPLLIVLFLAVYERLDWQGAWVKNIFRGGCIAMCAITAFCILVLDRRYSMFFPDFPDGFWFTMNPNIGRWVVLACTCGTLLAYAWRRMSAVVFLCTFGFVSLVGNYYISRFVIQPPTVTDRAAAVFEKIIGKERLDAGTVFDTEPGDGEVYRLLFDLPAAYDLKVVTNQDPITPDMLLEKQEWALVTSPRQVTFPFAESLVFGRYHLYLRGAKPSSTASVGQTELAPSDPFLTGACAGGQLIGFQQPESWGVWSAEDPAKLVLAREVRGRIRILFTGNVLGKERQTLQVQMGDGVKTVQLRAEPTTSELNFDLPTPTQSIVFRGITPRSPFELGISADIRRLGFGIDKLDCFSKEPKDLTLGHEVPR
jgi:phosphoglycerol transferase